MAPPSDAAGSLPLQWNNERLSHVQELRHQHQAVLANFPTTQTLLPEPQDHNTSPALWQLEIHWAATLLRALRSPQRSEIRDLVRQLFSSDFQYDDEYLVYTFPEDKSFDQGPSVWIEDVVASLCGIVVVARTKSRIQNLGGLEECANSLAARYRHRQTALCRLFDAHSTLSHVQVPFSRLLPRADDEAISKRAWEDQLFAVRTLLRHVRQGDRLASHIFVLRHYEDILRQQSSLRDRLPDPTRTHVADDDWVQDFIGAVYDIMRATSVDQRYRSRPDA
ncbi:hypothetical protein AK812_SmicGene42488 [Symbiodinium microadriaticum]|uniref:Uncharacterized protein n=1 Tax=Symbiodinium microadriaticum TaxID=2951 RepID=A0A1Q9C3F1_SYMMI|nr:hypothetical protein AK812_SmicGene42488 [Symbiodinium microadriaticum]